MDDDLFRGLTEEFDEVMIGTHTWPRVILSDEHPLAAAEGLARASTRIVGETTAEDLDVSVTALGGLFVTPPRELLQHELGDPETPLEPRMEFEERVSAAFNVILCELALCGFPSEPASPASISKAHRWRRHIVISSGSGRHQQRQSELMIRLIQEDNVQLAGVSSAGDVRDDALAARRARSLAEISPSLPQLTAGALHMHELRLPAEAVLDAWIVTEQLLEHWWDDYVATLSASRRKRLRDHRVYKASVRTEVLHTTGRLDEELYDQLNETRKLRNDLAHGAKISYAAADTARKTMEAAIATQLGESMNVPWWGAGVSW